MKSMTCQQLGGPCDLALPGTTDGTHEQALTSMKGRWKHPIAGMGWYRKVKSDFAALPES